MRLLTTRPAGLLKGKPTAKHWHLCLFGSSTKLAGTLAGRYSIEESQHVADVKDGLALLSAWIPQVRHTHVGPRQPAFSE